ncbi:GAF domain-containing protein [Paracrocinitomix mangrovi]|uniref:GAF domain-containing protein n=1 Tax=Paracrocinitomix mangrovi TaxID=2862509 RepID=UPI001C8E4269|nr:GAF domain-containing protein [Paracrocinitomix mangrovi]UKN02114.1 GAF domain-containing protein [Paracrocinitomix mangrovi]
MKKRLFYNFFIKVTLAFTFALFATSSAYSQNSDNQKKVDSLITQMISLEDSEEKADILNAIARLKTKENFVEGLHYAERSLAMSEDIKYNTGILNASLTLGRIYTYYYLDYFEAKHHLGRAVSLAEETADKELKRNVYKDYGFLMYSMGDCDQAISFNKKAILITEDLENYSDLAELYAYTADVYMDCGDRKAAMDYYSMTYTLFISDRLEYIAPAVRISSASYLRRTGDYKGSIEILKEAISIFHRDKLPRFESYAYAELAETQILKGDYIVALENANTGLEIAEHNSLLKEKLDNYKVQIDAYDSLGNYKKTYTTLIKYTRLKDSLSSSQFMEQNRKFQTNYEEMINQSKLSQLKEQQINHELELENQQLSRNIIIAVLSFVVVITILLILRIRFIRKKEKEMQVLTLAASHTNNSIILFDTNLRVEWVNKGFERLTGLTLAEVKGMYFAEFYHGEDENKYRLNEMKAKFETGRPFSMELVSKNIHTGEVYWISVNVSPIYEFDKLRSYMSVGSDITDIHNAQVALQKSHDRTILLNEIGRQITSTLSIHEIIEKMYENVNKLMDAQNLGIGIYRESDNSLHFPEPIERGKKLKSFVYPLNSSVERLAAKCYKDNLEFIVGSKEEIAEITGQSPVPVEGEQPESVIYIPLISKWKTMGVISVQSFAKNAYSDNELEVVRTLANYVAIGMENARLYENMEDMVKERTKEVTEQKEQLQVNFENIKMLSEIGVEIASSLDFEDVFEKLYATVAQMMDAPIFGLRLYHEKTRELEYKYEIENGERFESMTVSIEDKNNYSVWCIDNRKEILVNDNLSEYHKYFSELKLMGGGDMPNSIIFYPMIADGRIFGVFTVQSFKLNAYTKYHLAMVKTLSAYCAAALSNMELLNTLEHKVQERTRELAQKNKDIMASINYAKRIQRGILPPDSFIKQMFPQSFVFYRPRDIISGDFYWVERNLGKYFFAVVDCTGHGVPGALMSIIGKNILDQAVNEKEVDDPSMILTFLRAGLRVAFSSDEQEDGSEVEDGMDLAVCVYDPEDRILSFSGANSNLYIIHDSSIQVIKGEKSGVSASEFDNAKYVTHEIEIEDGDAVYLSSDGFPDQFGGDRVKKYSQRRFQELILRISSLPVNTQEDAFKQELEDWKRDYDQLDDICVMGVKF